jgi:hypothetical protein
MFFLGSSDNVRKELLYSLSNIICGTDVQKLWLIKSGKNFDNYLEFKREYEENENKIKNNPGFFFFFFFFLHFVFRTGKSTQYV